jgi:hypothetical protein
MMAEDPTLAVITDPAGGVTVGTSGSCVPRSSSIG